MADPQGLRRSKPKVHKGAAETHSLAAVSACGKDEPCPDDADGTKKTEAAAKAGHQKKGKKSKARKSKAAQMASQLRAPTPWDYANMKEWKADYPSCGKPGQSPIALTTECSSDVAGSRCSGGDVLGKHASYTVVAGCYLKNTGNLMEVEGTGYFGQFNVGKYQWKAKEMQFHTPSEHTLNGRRYDAELQIIHVHPTAAPLVVAIFVEEGDSHHDWLSSLGFDMLNMPRIAGGKMVLQEQVDLSDGLEDVLKGQYLSYDGTLTSPPCTGGVKWFVATTPLEASAQQLSNLKRRFSRNSSRPLQPTSGRMVYYNENMYSGAKALSSLVGTLLAAIGCMMSSL